MTYTDLVQDKLDFRLLDRQVQHAIIEELKFLVHTSHEFITKLVDGAPITDIAQSGTFTHAVMQADLDRFIYYYENATDGNGTPLFHGYDEPEPIQPSEVSEHIANVIEEILEIDGDDEEFEDLFGNDGLF